MSSAPSLLSNRTSNNNSSASNWSYNRFLNRIGFRFKPKSVSCLEIFLETNLSFWAKDPQIYAITYSQHQNSCNKNYKKKFKIILNNCFFRCIKILDTVFLSLSPSTLGIANFTSMIHTVHNVSQGTGILKKKIRIVMSQAFLNRRKFS